MATRVQVMVRLLKPQAAALEQIGEEMAAAANLEPGQPPFYHAGKVNTAEVIRRLLAKADDRLREP